MCKNCVIPTVIAAYPFMKACYEDDTDQVTLLLKDDPTLASREVMGVTPDGYDYAATPLWLASKRGNVDVCRCLLTAGASATDDDMDCAICRDDIVMYRMFAEHENKCPDLWMFGRALDKRSGNVLEEMLAKHPYAVHAPLGAYYETLLERYLTDNAPYIIDLDFLEIILEHQPKTQLLGRPILEIAFKSTKCSEYLVDALLKRVPLEEYTGPRLEGILKALLNVRLNVYSPNDDINFKFINKYLPSVLLACKGRKQQVTDSTLITTPVIRGYACIVERLLESFGKVLLTNSRAHGLTPLMWAAKKGHIEVAEVLLRYIPSSQLQSTCSVQGFTPLQYAKQENHTDTEKLLSEHM